MSHLLMDFRVPDASVAEESREFKTAGEQLRVLPRVRWPSRAGPRAYLAAANVSQPEIWPASKPL